MAGLQPPSPLPLRAFHEAAGATFGAVEGAERLVAYSGLEAEYEALCRGCALFDLSDRALLSVSGDARAAFLQRLLTQEVLALAPGEGVRACLLNRQSKVLSLMKLYADEGRLLLDAEPGGNHPLLAGLLRYRLSDPVDFEDLTGAFARFSLRGPKADEHALRAGAAPSSPGGKRTLARSSWKGYPLLVATDPGLSRELFVPPEAAEGLWKTLAEAGAVPAGWHSLETSRLEAAEPRYGADVTDENLFSEADLSDAVSHSKGCYIGQEIVTRVRTRGKVNRIRERLLVEGEARSGDEVLLGGAPAGRITSGARSPRAGGWLAFAYLKPQAVSGEPRLQVRSTAHGPVPATLAPPVRPR